MIDIGDKKLIIDAGPDFRTQMLRAGVKDVTALLLTHEHKDHIGGLDDIRAFNWVKNGEVDIYCNQRTKDVTVRIMTTLSQHSCYPGVPEMNIHVIDEEPFWIGEIKIEPITVMHYKLPVTAFRIDNFAYITDANFISEASMKKLEGVEYMVINALRKEVHLSHFTLDQAIDVVKTLHVKQASHHAYRSSDGIARRGLAGNYLKIYNWLMICYHLSSKILLPAPFSFLLNAC